MSRKIVVDIKFLRKDRTLVRQDVVYVTSETEMKKLINMLDKTSRFYFKYTWRETGIEKRGE